MEAFAAWQTIGPSLAGLMVFSVALVAWVLPARAGLLEFSQAETAFLFPAPVSRRQLLIHRLIRSQASSLITAIVMAIFLAPSAGFGRLRFALAMWALFVTIRVYFGAVSLTRAQLVSARRSARLAAWTCVSLFVAGTGVVLVAVVRQVSLQPVASASDLLVRVAGAAAAEWPSVVLWAVRRRSSAQFAANGAWHVQAMAASLSVLAAVTVWMLANDSAFEVTAGEAASEQRAGDARSRKPTVRVRQVKGALALSGRAEWAILWKNAMQTFRAVNVPLRRVVGPVVGALVGLSGAAVGMAANETTGPAGFVAAFGFAVAAAAVVFGPLIVRLDLRSDFEHLDLLKT
jgi:hypothetical protein